MVFPYLDHENLKIYISNFYLQGQKLSGIKVSFNSCKSFNVLENPSEVRKKLKTCYIKISTNNEYRDSLCTEITV